MTTSSLYDEYYYSHDCGRPYQRDDGWLNFFDQIAKRIIEQFEPKTVLDAGCAWGFLVEAFRNRGAESYGVDVSEYAIQNVHPDIKPYCWIGSITEPFPKKYDLITCIEVLEHLPQKEAEKAIENLCAHANEIVFSSTPFDYKEATHFNVHDPEYWAEQFARYGFYRDMEADLSCITSWAARFVKTKRTSIKLVREYERKFWQLRKENFDLRQLSVETQDILRQQEKKIYEKEQALSAHVAEKEQSVQALTAQVAEKEQSVQALAAQVGEIESSKAWKLVTVIRKIRVWLIPKDSHRERLAKKVWHGMKKLGKVRLLKRGIQTILIWRRAGLRAALQHTRWFIYRGMARVSEQEPYRMWQQANELGQAAMAYQREHSDKLAYHPLISIITPVYNPSPSVLRETIRSVLAQTYPYWELCLLDGNSSTPGVKDVLNEMAQADPRIRVRFLERNLGISGNSNEALTMARGEFIALLDHDDLLAPNIFYEVVTLLNQNPGADIIYFDEDKVSEDGRTRREPWFKPQRWSPDLLLSVNYLMHSVFRRTLVQDVGGFDPKMDGAQDWDLALRCTEKTQKIYHIPRVLYHWRQVPGSAASSAEAKLWAFDAQMCCIQAHLQRLGVQHAQVVSPGLWQLRILWPTSGAKVSIIIPTKDKVELLRPCLTSILTLTSYNYEIIVVDTGSTQAETYRYYADLATEPRVRIVKFTGPFNYSAVNNFGVSQATGDLLLFLNNDTQILEADWLTELVGWIERPEVGIVGCKLIRPNGTIQHAGIIMGLEGHGSHVFEGNPENYYGPFGSSEWVRDYHAVTGACLMMRRAVFEQVGGFDPAYQIGYGDIDLCLRTVEADYRVVYTPFARVLHHEGGTRGLSLPASDVLRASCTMFSMIQAGDTFYNPNLSYNQRRTAIKVPGEESRTERLFHILTQFDLVNPSNPQVQQISPIALPISTRPPNSELTRKLLLVSHDLSLSGAPLILYHLAQYLVQNGFTITVLSPSDGPINELYAQANIKVVIEPAALDDARVLAALTVEHGLVLANTILTWRAVHAARAFKRPCVWWIHESQFGQQLVTTKRQVADAFTVVDKIVFPTKATAALYTGFCTPNNAVCFHYGLDVPTPGVLPHGFEKKPGKFYVVNIASVERRKGQDVLLESIAMLPNDIRSQFEVFLVGRVLEQAYYRALAKRFKDLKNVHFIGEVDHPTALAYLQAADVYALPSRDEVLPIIMLEAMALGKGIVVSRVGGIAEVIEHGINGQLVEPANARVLAQSLELLYNNREALAQLGCQAQATYTERLTLTHSGQEFIRLLTGLADQPEREKAGH